MDGWDWRGDERRGKQPKTEQKGESHTNKRGGGGEKEKKKKKKKKEKDQK